jgi:hypothetical protein
VLIAVLARDTADPVLIAVQAKDITVPVLIAVQAKDITVPVLIAVLAKDTAVPVLIAVLAKDTADLVVMDRVEATVRARVPAKDRTANEPIRMIRQATKNSLQPSPSEKLGD